MTSKAELPTPEYIKVKTASNEFGLPSVDRILLFAIEESLKIYHLPGRWYEVPAFVIQRILDGENNFATELFTKCDNNEWMLTAIEDIYPNKRKEIIENITWDIDKLYVKSTELKKLTASDKDTTTSSLSLTEILSLINNEHYPEEISRQEKSAITKSLKKITGQLPKAFALCFKLAMSSMPPPASDQEDWTTYTVGEIENEAERCGIKSPMARDIYKALPELMRAKKKTD